MTFDRGETGELGRLQIGGGPVGPFDQGGGRLGRPGGQAEAQVDRRLQAVLEGLVVEADGGLGPTKLSTSRECWATL
jgi:hypothetical protein